MAATTDQALALAATLGHPFIDAPPSPYIWDGRVSYRGPAPATSSTPRGPMGPREICHELAHRLCATAEEQALPEWGLGREPTYGADASRDMPAPSRYYADEIEAAVCHIQGLLHTLLGEDPIVRLRSGARTPLQARGDRAFLEGRGRIFERISLARDLLRKAGQIS